MKTLIKIKIRTDKKTYSLNLRLSRVDTGGEKMFCLSKSSTHDDRQSETRKERVDRGAPDRGGSLMKNMAAGKPARNFENPFCN